MRNESAKQKLLLEINIARRAFKDVVDSAGDCGYWDAERSNDKFGMVVAKHDQRKISSVVKADATLVKVSNEYLTLREEFNDLQKAHNTLLKKIEDSTDIKDLKTAKQIDHTPSN